MNWIYAVKSGGPEFQLFQIFCLAILAWCCFISLAGFTIDFARHSGVKEIYKLPPWMVLSTGIGMLSVFTSTGRIILVFLHLMLYVTAPFGISIVATAFSLVCLSTFFWSFLG